MRDSIKQEIIDLLAKEKIQSSDQIFEKIGKIGDDTPLGRSKPSIYKAIQELRDADKKIMRIKFNDFQAYGIKEKRENAIFYALSTLPNENEFYSKILDILASDDEKKQLVALEELGDVQRVKLNWETLEKVERIVARTKNEKLLETTAILLMNHLDAGIRPKNLDKILNEFDKKVDEVSIFKAYGKLILMLFATAESEKAIHWLKWVIKEYQRTAFSTFFEASRWHGVLELYKKDLVEFSLTLEDEKRGWLKSIRSDAAAYGRTKESMKGEVA